MQTVSKQLEELISSEEQTVAKLSLLASELLLTDMAISSALLSQPNLSSEQLARLNSISSIIRSVQTALSLCHFLTDEGELNFLSPSRFQSTIQ